MPVMAMAMPYWSQAATTLSSCTEPPGWATYLTPKAAATSMLSRKGKKASEARQTSPRASRWSRRSASVISTTGRSKLASKARRSWAGMASRRPSMKRTRALTLSWRLRPGLKGSAATAGARRSHQVWSLRAASLTQSRRDCWPAPTPTSWPSRAKAIELDWVYLQATAARRRSRRFSGGMWAAVTTRSRSAGTRARSLRRWTKPTPKTSLYSSAAALGS
mmetsp:Transcript_12883/g.40883  ORF Transcript_12883/g.40883 Transcript_12883/m.40883 type:complete len:220 (+) Transcript_12883:280-939(+)